MSHAEDSLVHEELLELRDDIEPKDTDDHDDSDWLDCELELDGEDLLELDELLLEEFELRLDSEDWDEAEAITVSRSGPGWVSAGGC